MDSARISCLVCLSWRSWECLLGGSLRRNGSCPVWAIPPLEIRRHLLLTLVAYFGVPVIGLGLLAPVVAGRVPKRILYILLITGTLPILELVVIAQLNLMHVAWYYVFISLLGCVGLSLTWSPSLSQHRRLRVLGSAVVLYYAVFLVGYYTRMHGDRLRWQEAVAFLAQEANVTAEQETPAIFATVPGIIVYYLGAIPHKPWGIPGYKACPDRPPYRTHTSNSGTLLEAGVVSKEYAAWFAAHCTLAKRFEAQTGPVDRSVLVYRCPP